MMERDAFRRRVIRFLLGALLSISVVSCDSLFGPEKTSDGTTDDSSDDAYANIPVPSGLPVLEASKRALPNDEEYGRQWAHDAMDSELAWGLLDSPEIRGELQPTVVAVLDTLVDINHPDLRDSIAEGGWDFSGDVSRPIEESLRLEVGDEDSIRHGTHVSGILAASYDNGLGIAGMGKNLIKLLPVRVLDSIQSGSAADLLEGIIYAAGLNDALAPPIAADVITLSLGSRTPLDTIASAIEDVRDVGVSLVAASGNSNFDTVDYPARYDTVIAVGSVDYRNGAYVRSTFGTTTQGSNYGPALDIVAPGGLNSLTGDGILSTIPNGFYGEQLGTSMATPYVAAIVGLLYAWDSSITPSEVLTILTSSAVDIGPDVGRDDETGYGLVNANYALRTRLMYPYGPYQPDASANPELAGSSVGERTVTFQDYASEEPVAVVPGSILLHTKESAWRLFGEVGAERELRRLLETLGGAVVKRPAKHYWIAQLSEDDATEALIRLRNHSLIQAADLNPILVSSGDDRSASQESGSRLELIASGANSNIEGKKGILLTTTGDIPNLIPAASAQLRRQLEIALERYPAAIVVAAGTQPTAGYTLSLISHTFSQGSLELSYRLVKPSEEALVAQVLTTPYMVLGVSNVPEELHLTAEQTD